MIKKRLITICSVLLIAASCFSQGKSSLSLTKGKYGDGPDSIAASGIIKNLSDEQLQQPYPIDKFGADKTNAFALTYLLAHLAYHQGQVNYHRRLLNK